MGPRNLHIVIGNLELANADVLSRFPQLSRRAVLAASAALFASPKFRASVPNRIQLGTQTNAWTIDPNPIETFYSVLDRIRDLGFKGFETGYRKFQSATENLSAVRARLESTGLTFFGIHIFLGEYDGTTKIAPEALYSKVVDIGSALGAQYLILSGSPCKSDTDLANKAAGLNHAGEVASRKGLVAAYHNHAPEFQNSNREIKYLIENTDSKSVTFVVDAGHAFRAGADVPTFLAGHAARVAGVHLRDSKRGSEVPLAEGEFPLQTTASALRSAGWRGWALLEEERADGSKPGDAAIVPALTALRGAFPS